MFAVCLVLNVQQGLSIVATVFSHTGIFKVKSSESVLFLGLTFNLLASLYDFLIIYGFDVSF